MHSSQFLSHWSVSGGDLLCVGYQTEKKIKHPHFEHKQSFQWYANQTYSEENVPLNRDTNSFGEKVGLRRAEYSSPLWPDVQRHSQCCDLNQMEARGHASGKRKHSGTTTKIWRTLQHHTFRRILFPGLFERKQSDWMAAASRRTHKEINDETHQSDTFYEFIHPRRLLE